MIDLAKINNQISAAGIDQTKMTAEPRPLPPEGVCKLRFVSYVELGKHESEYKGAKTIASRLRLTFELSGGKDNCYAPEVKEDGTQVPITVDMNLSLSSGPRAKLPKLLSKMSQDGTTHLASLLGKPYLGRVYHREYESHGETKKALSLENETDGISVKGAFVENPDTGEVTPVKVPEAISPIRCFIWDLADKDQWDSLFIDGQYAAYTDESGKVIREAASKNKLQEKIKQALNYAGSPIEAVLSGATEAVADSSSTDALNGIV